MTNFAFVTVFHKTNPEDEHLKFSFNKVQIYNAKYLEIFFSLIIIFSDKVWIF